jgi:hypothetical protein
MKLKCGVLLFAVFPAGLLAQSATVQMQCHTLASSGGYLAPDETFVNGMAAQVSAYATVLKPAVSAPASPAPTPAKPVETAPAALPNEAGMFLAANGGYTKIMGQIVEFERSGSLLASKVTLGVKTAKGNAQLLGPHATTVVTANPTFYFVPAKQEADAGVNAGDLILIRLEQKKERRQFEVSAEGDWRASKGISLTHQVQLDRSEVTPGVFKITPVGELNRGEYGLYLARGEGLAPYIYDFSIQ